MYTNEIVSHNGQLWQAQWWTQGQEPGTTGQWGAWQPVNP
ncbi:carbohydrate-binding protein [Paenibacillus tarimensis]|nr:carbohydrate-binding protein [Paenibacillus tarimensis]